MYQQHLAVAGASIFLLFPVQLGATQFCVVPLLLFSNLILCQPPPCTPGVFASVWLSPSLLGCCLHPPTWQQAPGCPQSHIELACLGVPGDLEADSALGTRKAVTSQLLSCQCKLAMEPWLLWDWGEALCIAEEFFSWKSPLLALG